MTNVFLFKTKQKKEREGFFSHTNKMRRKLILNDSSHTLTSRWQHGIMSDICSTEKHLFYYLTCAVEWFRLLTTWMISGPLFMS